MIDWLTLSVDLSHLGPAQREMLDMQTDRIQRITKDGELAWEKGCWDSLRSDMTGMAYCVASSLRLGGSPASVLNPNNVFGPSCIQECALSMIKFFEKHTGILLPKEFEKWSCTRADVTQNYNLDGQVAVNQALQYMKFANTRGHNVEKKYSTVYWNKSSSLRSGKAYNKYEHALKMMKSNKAFYTPEEVELLQKVIRLELKLGRHWFQRQDKKWFELTVQDLEQQHNDFFNDVVGDLEVPTMDNLFNKLLEVCPTEGQARAAFDFFTRVKQLGLETVKRTTTKSTFYRCSKHLKLAGLSSADLNAGRILEFRRKTIVLGNPVSSWDDLKQAS